MNKDFVDAIFHGDLEQVRKRMEEGDLCEEDVDQPHDEEGCTPLITACQKGLTGVVQFLLEKGADVTLCNHDDQTAVHLSGSVLQGELLAVASRCLSPQAQLLCAAWRGDLHSLQNLLKEPLDVNIQNRDGLTPLMLAVRDVDLFEGLGALMVWEYRPVEVVRELLHHQAALSMYDHRGRCALHYAAQVKSTLREELVHLLLESLSQPALEPDYFDLEDPSTNPPLSPLTQSVLIQSPAKTEDLAESSECPSFSQNRKTRDDQRISLSFHTAAETLKAMRQEYQELEDRNSQGVSLPSLWDRGRRGDRLCSLDTGQGQVKMTGRSCQPMTPRTAGRGDSLNPNLTAPHPPQLSQSAPLLGEPLLDSGSMLRVRAHIQTRLGGSEFDTEINGRRRSLPILCPRPVRTPRHLAPLDRGQREGMLLLGPRHPLPLKPITLLPLASMSKVKRERLSRRGSRGSRRAKGGSEESSSSSVSSQGSLDLEEEQQEEEDAEEEEEEEEDRESTGATANQPQGSTEKPSVSSHCERVGLELLPSAQSFTIDFSNADRSHKIVVLSGEQGPIEERMDDGKSVISCAERTEDCVALFGVDESELLQRLSSEASERSCNSRDIHDPKSSILSNTEKGQTVSEKTACSGELCKGEIQALNRDTMADITISKNELKSQTTVDPKHLGLPIVNITVSESDVLADEKSNPNKIHKNKEKGSGTFYHTNQSFNVLAHNRITRRSKLNQRSTSRSSHLKANITNPPDLIVSGEASVKPCAPKTSSSKTGQKTTAPHLPRNRSSEQLRPVLKRSGGDKGSSNKLEALARKQSLQRDLKCTRQPKKVGVLGTPRAKSAVDFVTYSDMFREINQGHEGPAIYEMFATPVYENIRKSTLSVRVSPRQIQSAPPRKTQGRRNYRCPKPSENNQQKKTQREKSNPTSGKHQKRSDVLPRGKPHRPLVSEEEEKDTVFISGLNWNIKTTRSELNFEEEKESYALVDQEGEQTLSVIEEVLSNYLSETCVNLVLTEDENPHTQSQPQEITQQIPNDHLSSYMQDANEGPMASGFKNDHGCVKAEATSSKSFPCHPMINTWTSGSSDRTMSPMFRKYLDVAGEGPLTDDLLQNLAKELISLEEREVTLQPERRDSGPGGEREASQTDTRHPLPQGITSPIGEHNVSGSCAEDAVMWTKGEVLGRGAYGTVYCGLTSQGQLIAVKQVALDDSDPESGAREYQRLQDEVDLLKTLHHTNIVGFLGTTLQDNVVSIFMEYVPGGSIASIIHRFGPLPEKVLVLYTRQILEGVAYLHENRVIHRDLKGNNVMLMPTGIVKLIDFGCARRLSCLTHTNSNSELLRSVHGTPYWMAPEVINETGHGRKSDIWSIGCTVFEMATGRPPLAHMDKMAALFYIGARRGLMPTLPDEFSEDAKNFVQACLTSDQKDRPSAQELLTHPFIPRTSTLPSENDSLS